MSIILTLLYEFLEFLCQKSFIEMYMFIYKASYATNNLLTKC